MSEKLVIAIPTSGRLEYFERCLKNLSLAVASEPSLFILVDFGVDPVQIHRIVERYFSHAIIELQEHKRLYINAAIITLRNLAFERLDPDLVLTLEDDILVSPFYVRTLLELHAWASQEGETIVQSSVDSRLIRKIGIANLVRRGLSTGCNTLMSRAAWKAMRPTMDAYMVKWASGSHQHMDTPGVREWFRELVSKTTPLPGDGRRDYGGNWSGIMCDSALQVAAMVAGIRTANLYFNRAITIGEFGANFTPEIFASVRDLKLMPLEVDALPHSFCWHVKVNFVVLSHDEPEIFTLLDQLIGQEVFVIDDGSKADHFELIKAHPAQPTCLRRSLGASFAAQRNFVHAFIPEGEWIMVIDADEVFDSVKSFIAELTTLQTEAASRRRLNTVLDAAGHAIHDSFYGLEEEWHVRAYRNHPERIFWMYHLHEELQGYESCTELRDSSVLHVKPKEKLDRQHLFYGKRFAHGRVDLSKAEKIEGFSFSPELNWLAREAFRHRCIVEIGALNGRTTRALADNTTGTVYVVDHFMGSQGEPSLTTDQQVGDVRFKTFLRNVFDLIQSGKVVPLRMSSNMAAAFFMEANLQPDLVFIDGSHTAECVAEDILFWRLRLACGGVLCGHDSNWASVMAALDETKTEYTVPPETTIWVRK